MGDDKKQMILYYVKLPYQKVKIKKKEKEEGEFKKFIEMFTKLHIHIAFRETLEQIHIYVKFMKDLLSKRRKL